MLVEARWSHTESGATLESALFQALEALGPRRRVLVIPPDITRRHSRAGELTRAAWKYYGPNLACILPALGTHAPMTECEIQAMYGDLPRQLFAVHDWRNGLACLGEVPDSVICDASEGRLRYSWPVQVNRLLVEGGFDLILSIGQVVPHEVAGMASYNKNLFIGAGGKENIDKSHYLGAVYGMERIMGRAENPVRRVLNYASDHFAAGLPVLYALTVIGNDDGGIFLGDGIACFEKAAALSLQLNFTMLERPIQKAVVYLDPQEFKTTWLGNKAIYRTRMAMADGGELIVLAPGVKRFGEDLEIDGLIRKYGYTGTAAVMGAVERHPDLAERLSAAAHLIHGSSEGRFRITYCPGGMTCAEIEAAGFGYAPLGNMLKQYDPTKLADGYNVAAGEEIFFVSNPGLGLWAHKARMLR